MSNTTDVHQMDTSERERMRDVHLLLNNLFRREEATVLMVLDCLFDVGSHHWIQDNVQFRMGQTVLKGTTRTIKPIFKAIAIRWFKRHVPTLLADWLYGQVTFEADGAEASAEGNEPEPTVALHESSSVASLSNPSMNSAPVLPEDGRSDRQTVDPLRHRVHLLTGMLTGIAIGVVGTLIGTLH